MATFRIDRRNKGAEAGVVTLEIGEYQQLLAQIEDLANKLENALIEQVVIPRQKSFRPGGFIREREIFGLLDE